MNFRYELHRDAYEFTYDNLVALFRIMTARGPRAAFIAYWTIEDDAAFTTEAVEDFSAAFYTAYNRFFPGTF